MTSSPQAPNQPKFPPLLDVWHTLRAMDASELQRLLQEEESDRAERTVSLTDTDKFGEAICAFANDLPNNRRPGYLFVGANQNGTASGAVIDDGVLLRLANIRSDGNVQPLPVIIVQKHTLGGGDMAVVETLPSDLPPVRYKGHVWVRVGPSRRRATEAEERILAERRASLARTWDARPCREATLDDLALDLFIVSYRSQAIAGDVIEENQRNMDGQLAALRFYDLRAGCPTHAGILLFGKNPTFFVPGGYVQYVRYAGPTITDEPVTDRRFDGDFLTNLRGLDALGLDLARARPVRTDGMSERMVYDYPPKAMRELLMNAIIHRSYESTTPVLVNHFADRTEILNPGGLYGDLTPDEFPNVTAYRNPVLAEAARVLGFVNRYGRGIALAQAELARNESPQAQFDLHPNHVLVTVRARP